jgi:hypothetical protein
VSPYCRIEVTATLIHQGNCARVGLGAHDCAQDDLRTATLCKRTIGTAHVFMIGELICGCDVSHALCIPQPTWCAFFGAYTALIACTNKVVTADVLE